MKQKKYLKSSVVAEMLDISVRTLEDWRRQNIGPRWIDMGRKTVRYDLDEIQRWVEERVMHRSKKAVK